MEAAPFSGKGGRVEPYETEDDSLGRGGKVELEAVAAVSPGKGGSED